MPLLEPRALTRGDRALGARRLERDAALVGEVEQALALGVLLGPLQEEPGEHAEA